MQLTDEQLQAVDLFQRSDSLKISAFAGTGKTSTLTGIANSTRNGGLYLAFNKSIATEAATKFPSSVDCRTTHSVALRSVPSAFRGNKDKLFSGMQGNRVTQMLDMKDLAIGAVLLKARSLGYLTTKTVQRFCQSGDREIGLKHVPLSGKLAILDEKHRDEFAKYVAQLAAYMWERMSDPRDDAPLGHDGYLKLWSLSQPTLPYDFILLDEAQDTNDAVLSVLLRQSCQLTLVGDRHQQIYEWRGAINAMENVDTQAESSLTQSFRFGETIANAATDVLRMLREHRTLKGNPARQSRILAYGDAEVILCRTNGGVVATVLEQLGNRLAPHVVGGVDEIMRLLEDVTRLKGNVPAASPELFGFANWTEVVEFSESEDGESLRSFVKIVNGNGEQTLIQALRGVSADEIEADVIISTGHKAKGREWDRVRLHSDFEPRVKPEGAPKIQINDEETRLLYVAATRARTDLIVPSRLARRWNAIGASLESPASPVAPASAAPQPVRLPPPLPPFARPVEPPSAAPKQQQQATAQAPSTSQASSAPVRRRVPAEPPKPNIVEAFRKFLGR